MNPATAIAILGLGSIGKRHTKNLLALGYTNIILCDSDTRKHADLQKHFPRLRIESNPAFMADEPIFAVFVCTPTALHVSHAQYAIDHGCHVFVEKPLSHTLDGVERLCASAREKKRVLMVGFNLPYHPCLRKVKECLSTGMPGKVSSVRAVFGSFMPHWRPGDYHQLYSACRSLGGGVLLDSIHEIDYLRWLFGEPVKIVSLVGKRSLLDLDVEDTADILFLFPGVIQANVHLDYSNHSPTRHLEIVGSNGTLFWDFTQGTVRFFSGETRTEDVLLDASGYDFNQTYLEEIKDFFSCIQNNTMPRSTGEDAAKSLACVLSCLLPSAGYRFLPSSSCFPPSIVAIVQARTGSTRLPRKVLAPVNGVPLLGRVIQRLKRSALLSAIVVATTSLPSDDEIAAYCTQLNIPFFRGSEDDVLDRYYQAAKLFSADIIVRITSDCPLIDPSIVDQAISLYLEHSPRYDYVSNRFVLSFPDGLDTEVFPFSLLEQGHHEATLQQDREHVTTFIWKQPDRFRIGNLSCPENLSHLRWTVDYPEDLDFVRAIFSHFGDSSFSFANVLALLKENPGIQKLNDSIPKNIWLEQVKDGER